MSIIGTYQKLKRDIPNVQFTSGEIVKVVEKYSDEPLAYGFYLVEFNNPKVSDDLQTSTQWYAHYTDFE